MEPRQADKAKYLSLFLAIFLVSLFFTLSLLDAPEYVHCEHLGVCEFLELSGDLSTSRKAVGLITAITSIANQNFLLANDLVRYICLPSWVENLMDSESSLQNLALSTPLYMLSRFINPYHNHKILCSPLKKGGKILIDQEHTSPLIGNSLPSQTLQIITTSIIKS